jgi:5'-nucleotidase
VKVLVTNDDGVGRPGLGALARSLAGAGHDVRVLAPVDERSGSASSLGVVRHGAVVPLQQVVLPGLESAVVHAVDGPPSLGVRAACAGALGWTPEVVVSGINPGLNTGRLVLHSGTVGAALTAASRDITGVAVSTDVEGGAGLASAALLATWLVDVLAGLGCPPVALNLNVPGRPLDQLRGVSAASLSGASIEDVTFDAATDGLRVRRWQNAPPFETGTDAHLLSDGWAALSTVTPPWACPEPDERIAGLLHERWEASVDASAATA